MKYLYINHSAPYAQKYQLQPADRIVESIFQTGLSKHHSIYLGVDENGIEWISENQKFTGVHLIKASDFFQRDKIYQVRKFHGNNVERVTAVNRALTVLGQPYDLVVNNCEHYASFVQTGTPQSQQVRNGAVVIGVAAFLLLISTIKI